MLAGRQRRAVLVEHPTTITIEDLKHIDGSYAAWDTGENEPARPSVERPQDQTPHEVLDKAIRTINSDLKFRLLRAILEQSPTFFEELVLDVLVAMGCGGSRRDAAEHVGRTGDEGIDGAINQKIAVIAFKLPQS